jgi:triosephosphate isomerase
MRPLLIANWKMNPQSLVEARELFRAVKRKVRKKKNIKIVICPPSVYLPFFKETKEIQLGAQNCFWEEKGAFTGEISPLMLRNLGCRYVILGHSERRTFLKESDEMINKKIKAVLKAKLKPILCLGETLKEREKGRTFKVLKEQLKNAFFNFQTEKIPNLILAYEPVWAIGTGKACQPSQAEKVALYLKKTVNSLFSPKLIKEFLIVYGGSVNKENAFSYLKEKVFDGLLIGGASLDKEEFFEIINVCQKKYLD